MANGKMNKMFKQVQKVQAQMVKMQEELKSRQVEASSGGGVVRAVVSGDKELQELHIEPELLEENDVEMLTDLVISAVNEALRKAEAMVNEEMQKIGGNLGLPGNLF
jgi:DNA-binding YbaB/EbfC family protein